MPRGRPASFHLAALRYLLPARGAGPKMAAAVSCRVLGPRVSGRATLPGTHGLRWGPQCPSYVPSSRRCCPGAESCRAPRAPCTRLLSAPRLARRGPGAGFLGSGGRGWWAWGRRVRGAWVGRPGVWGRRVRRSWVGRPGPWGWGARGRGTQGRRGAGPEGPAAEGPEGGKPRAGGAGVGGRTTAWVDGRVASRPLCAPRTGRPESEWARGTSR